MNAVIRTEREIEEPLDEGAKWKPRIDPRQLRGIFDPSKIMFGDALAEIVANEINKVLDEEFG